MVANGMPPSESTPLIQWSEPPLSPGTPSTIDITCLGQHYGFRRFHVCLLAAAIMAGMPAGVIMGGTPVLLSRIQAEFGTSDAVASFIHTAVVLGSMPGVLLTGFMADRLGRRFTIIGCALGISGLSLLFAAVPRGGQLGVPCLLLLRFLLGVPFGGLYILLVPYVMEFMCDGMRGAASILVLFFWPSGHVLGLQTVAIIGEESWRVCLALAPLAPALVGSVMMFMMPESPRWLRVRRSNEKAQAALDTVFASPCVVGQAHVGRAPTITVETGGSGDGSMGSWATVRELFGPSLIRATLVITCLYTVSSTLLVTSIAWGPRFLGMIAGEKASLTFLTWCEVADAVSCVCGTLLADCIGRRVAICFSFFMETLVFLTLASSGTLQEAEALWLAHRFLLQAHRNIVLVVMAESFPTSVRGTAMGLSTLVGRLCSFVVPAVLGALFAVVSIHSLMCAISVWTACGAAMSLCLPSDLSQKPTEDVVAQTSIKSEASGHAAPTKA